MTMNKQTKPENKTQQTLEKIAKELEELQIKGEMICGIYYAALKESTTTGHTIEYFVKAFTKKTEIVIDLIMYKPYTEPIADMFQEKLQLEPIATIPCSWAINLGRPAVRMTLEPDENHADDQKNARYVHEFITTYATKLTETDEAIANSEEGKVIIEEIKKQLKGELRDRY